MDWMDVQALEAQPAGPVELPGGSAALLEGLNPEQRAAVTHATGPLLILAGPGSGKTRVITRRIAWLVAQGTGAARGAAGDHVHQQGRARDARARRAPAAGEGPVDQHLPRPGRAHPAARDRAPGPGLDARLHDLRHARPQPAAAQDPVRVELRLGALQAGGRRAPGSARGRTAPPTPRCPPTTASRPRRWASSRAPTTRRCAKNNALDFDDLLLKLLELFESQPGVRDAYSSRFKFVMVDEYQDTNRVQYEITRHLSAWHKNLAVCGDPDQSIYAWRGADIRNILDFEQDFGAPRVVKLEQNYRSTRNILEAAQAVIAHNRARKQKSTISASGEAGEQLCVCECGSRGRRGARDRAADRGPARARHAALAGRRSSTAPTSCSARSESALRRGSLPYRIVAGVEFYERREIRDLLAWLKLAVNPADDVAFLRVVNVPARGIGEKSLAELAQFAADRRIPLAQAVRSSEIAARIRGRARAGLAAFAKLLDKLQALAERPAAVAIDGAARRDRRGSLAGGDGGRDAGRPRRPTSTSCSRTPSSGTRRPRRRRLARNLRGFLQEVALVSETDQPEAENERVTLMTLHAAKGLEFDAVFIAGCEEELLPHARALAETRGGDPDAGLEEERRLLYVGMTRARKRLFLTWARERMQFGSFSVRRPSRFLEELPRALVESTEEEAFPAEDALPAEPGFKAGDRVEHAHFGRGTVVRVQGTGVNARATVRFPAHGERQLLLLLRQAAARREEPGRERPARAAGAPDRRGARAGARGRTAVLVGGAARRRTARQRRCRRADPDALRHGRRQRADARPVRAHGQGRAQRRERADPGRDRHRQGARRARAARALAPQAEALPGRELRRGPCEPARERALRPQEGQLHRRDRRPARTFRGRRRRHGLPGRDRRHAAPDAVEAAARAAGGRGAARRLEQDRQGRRAHRRRDATRTCRRCARRAASARTSSSGST